MSSDNRKVEVDEIVKPDIEGNPWPAPRGFPLAFGKTAWFIMPPVMGKRYKTLIAALDKAKDQEIDSVEGEGKLSDLLKARHDLLMASLMLQYSPDSIARFNTEVVEGGVLDLPHYLEVVRMCMGAEPDKVAVVKKK